jgi:hypothetical protein
MTVQMVLIAAVVSTAGLPDLPAKPKTPIGIELEQQNRKRIAQGKRDTDVPGALPGRSESSGEVGPTGRKAAKRKAKPADLPKDTKSKNTPREGGKKDPQ